MWVHDSLFCDLLSEAKELVEHRAYGGVCSLQIVTEAEEIVNQWTYIKTRYNEEAEIWEMKLKRGAAREYCGSISHDGRAAAVGIWVTYFLRNSIK